MKALAEVNFGYYYTVPPPGLEGLVEEEGAAGAKQIFNLWFGRKDQPAMDAGISVAPILHYIYHALANGHEDTYIYLMNWFASFRQMVNLHGNTTCLVLRSPPGTGKSSFVHSLGTMLGNGMFFETNDCTDVTGYFTAELREKILVHLDEFKYKDQEGMNKLKHLITGGEVRQRRMQKDATNYAKWFSTIISANEYQVLLSEPGERRFVFLELPKSLAGSKQYLTALANVLYGDGEFVFRGEVHYNQDNIGPGIYLFANYLDNWHLDARVPLLKIPHNITLYEHQTHSMDSVGLWWFDKLKNGMTVDPNLLDDTLQKPVARNRHRLRLEEIREQLEASLLHAQFFAADGQVIGPLFTEKWLARVVDQQGKIDFGALVTQKLLKDFEPGPRSKTSCFRSYPAAQLYKLDFLLAVGNRTIDPSYSQGFLNTRKFQRAVFFSKLYGNELWVRFVFKEQFYQLYLSQSFGRGRVEIANNSTFFNKFKTWTCDKSAENRAHCSESRVTVNSTTLYGRDQMQGMARENFNPARPTEPAPSVRIPRQRYYMQLDTLHRHREAFFDAMLWDRAMWDEVWTNNYVPSPEDPAKIPWYWFGDKKK